MNPWSGGTFIGTHIPCIPLKVETERTSLKVPPAADGLWQGFSGKVRCVRACHWAVMHVEQLQIKSLSIQFFGSSLKALSLSFYGSTSLDG